MRGLCTADSMAIHLPTSMPNGGAIIEIMPMIATVVSSCDVGRILPDPAGYLAALAAMKTPIEQTAFVGHGTAELAGYTLKLHEARRKTLSHVVSDLFPKGGDVSRAEFWCGLRPMTPDGTPVVGATPIAKLFLATGHGTLGWTMAAGTGRVMADVISGRAAGIDLSGLTIARYAGAVR